MKPAAPNRFGLWLQTRFSGSAGQTLPDIPEGSGPLLLVYAPADQHSAVLQICAACKQIVPELRWVRFEAGQSGKREFKRAALDRYLIQAKPFAVVVLSADLPVILLAAASQAKVEVILANLQLGANLSGWGWQSAMYRSMLNGARKLFVLDEPSQQIALRNGIRPEKIEITGPITEIRPPLAYNEAERSEIAGLLRGRTIWLAAAIPQAEEAAVLQAHIALLHMSHRAFLIFVPADPDRQESVAAHCEDLGLSVTLRGQDDGELADGLEVLIADGVAELGLWYRLATVSFIGGTLSGEDVYTRPPFEAAALGSAIVHGSHCDKFADEWHPLLNAKTTRPIRNDGELAEAVSELSLPVNAASLATTAWSVSTGGAAIAAQIAAELRDVALGPPA